MKLLVTTLLVFLATNIDFTLILTIVFAEIDHTQDRFVYFGNLTAMTIIIATALIMTFFVHFLPEEWMLGLLGLVPLYMGLKAFAELALPPKKQHHESLSTIGEQKGNQLLRTILFMCLATSGDNVGIYVSLLAGKNKVEWILIFGLFMALTLLSLISAKRLAEMPVLSKEVQKHQRVIIPFLLVALGFFIMKDSGLLTYLLTVIGK